MRKFLAGIGVAGFLLVSGGACRPSDSWGDLSRLAAESGTDKGPGRHDFTQFYEGFLAPLRDRPIRLFEIGVDQGHSLRLWEKYFPKAEIFGADIVDKSVLDTERVHTGIADQADRAALARFAARFGPTFDVILDDGGHTMRQQQVSFGFLFRCLKPGGLYIIEDVHTSLGDLFPEYGAAPDGRNTTLTMIEGFLRTMTISSPYMRRSEMEYLNRTIESCVLTFSADRSRSMSCIIRKRTVLPSQEARVLTGRRQ